MRIYFENFAVQRLPPQPNATKRPNGKLYGKNSQYIEKIFDRNKQKKNLK